MFKYKNQADYVEIIQKDVIVGIISNGKLRSCPRGCSLATEFTIKELEHILHKMKAISPNGMIRVRKLNLAEVLKHIGKEKWKIWTKDKLCTVSMQTERMLLAGREQECACCHLKATHFWLERSGCKPPHFNMYGLDAH